MILKLGGLIFIRSLSFFPDKWFINFTSYNGILLNSLNHTKGERYGYFIKGTTVDVHRSDIGDWVTIPGTTCRCGVAGTTCNSVIYIYTDCYWNNSW